MKQYIDSTHTFLCGMVLSNANGELLLFALEHNIPCFIGNSNTAFFQNDILKEWKPTQKIHL
ncbi:MAG: hypothetical protein HYV32_03935 [Candidatus Kerfeldbacteria bacterium]|nr:hypothetical protein [Candidatus Kerfeldbacteria bacterium]